MTPPARSAREPSSVAASQEPDNHAGTANLAPTGGGDPLAEVCEALERAVLWAAASESFPDAIDWEAAGVELRAALATLRRARVVAWSIAHDEHGCHGIVSSDPQEVQRWRVRPEAVLPLIAFEEPERDG